jgi:predicted nucleic acid-binding protein
LSILLDTDVLSAFAKISGLELLHELFSSDELLITNGVYEELTYIRESGYDFVDQILDFVRNTPMDDEELDMYHSFLKRTNLGKGELQCIAVCIMRGYPFIMNDRKAKNFASVKGVVGG